MCMFENVTSRRSIENCFTYIDSSIPVILQYLGNRFRNASQVKEDLKKSQVIEVDYHTVLAVPGIPHTVLKV